jgi:hypothetical protein
MQRMITFKGRPLKLTVSQRAQTQLARRTSPLFLEMELYFSCLIRKRVLVHESMDDLDAVTLADKLMAWFRPVVTETCAMRGVERDNPPVKDMPILNPERFYPHWLTLDYRRGKWLADFGYVGSKAGSA